MCDEGKGRIVRIAIYARLSRDNSGISENVDLQIVECREYAEQRGWMVVGVFSDNDVSASKYTTKPRPGYHTMITAIKNDRIEAILATEMTRLYRRLDELRELMHLAEGTSLTHIVTIDETGYDLSTGQGIHNAVSAVNSAMLESRRISERVSRKFRARAKIGLAHGGSRPYGYESGGMVIKEDEAQIVRQVAARIIQGTPITAIVRDLNRQGIPSASGKKWGHKSLTQVMIRKRLIGVRTHKEIEYPAAWPPILTPEEWEMVQTALRRSFRRRAQGRTYLLTGLLECGACAKPLLGDAHPNHAGEEPKRRYSCRKGDNYGGYGAALAPKTPEVRPLLERYQFLQGRLQDLVQDYATGLLNRQQLAQAKSAVESEIEEIQGRLSAAQPLQAFTVIQAGEAVAEAWEREGIEWRRNLISLLVEKILVNPGYPGRSRWRGFVFDPEKVEIRWRV